MSDTSELVDALAGRFRAHMFKALQVELDGSVESLAFTDHYLAQARNETREPILSLLAAEAGAYFAHIVLKNLGAHLVGDGKDPRRTRVLLKHHPVYFAPTDLAHLAVVGEDLAADDPRHPVGPPLDERFVIVNRADGPGAEEDALDDATWVEDRLAATSVPQDVYFSLTGRYESLEYVLELLAERHASADLPSREYTVADYVSALDDGVG